MGSGFGDNPVEGLEYDILYEKLVRDKEFMYHPPFHSRTGKLVREYHQHQKRIERQHKQKLRWAFIKFVKSLNKLYKEYKQKETKELASSPKEEMWGDPLEKL